MMLNVPKRANDAMHLSMLTGFEVRSFTFTESCIRYSTVGEWCCRAIKDKHE